MADFPLSAHAVKLQSCGSIRETAGRLPSGCSGLQSKDSLTMLPIPAKCLLIICRMVAKELQVKIKSNCSPLAALSFPYGYAHHLKILTIVLQINRITGFYSKLTILDLKLSFVLLGDGQVSVRT